MRSIGQLGIGKTEPYAHCASCDRCKGIKPVARLVRSFHTMVVCRDCRRAITGVEDRRGLVAPRTARATISAPPALPATRIAGLLGPGPVIEAEP